VAALTYKKSVWSLEKGKTVFTRLEKLKKLFTGKPLATDEIPHQTIPKFVGLAVFASDALSSVAYATEEILIVLALAGAVAFGVSIPIAAGIGVLLIILTTSYRQTLFAYPGGGGAYIVAYDNMGERAAQVAGASLLTDYILTVSVSIAAGVAQITSAFPELVPWRVWIAVALIVFMMVVNLRGVKESGRLFAVPTYFFIAMVFGTLAVGFFRFFSGTLPKVTDVPAASVAIQPLAIFLILRAFSSGCTALTGVEAISNGITAFKEPRSRNAATTMAWMSGILGTMFLGITFLANQISVVPTEHETVISQMARTIWGSSEALYLMMISATTLILIIAANTAFADFPRLAALHAADGFLPRQLTHRGNRLVFSKGIMTLAAVAAGLIIFFQANVTRLIPLYAIGVFLSFTISQAGMVIRWRKVSQLAPGEEIVTKATRLVHDPRWRTKQIINAFGATATFVVMMIFAITKFTHGAWVVVIIIPAMTWMFFQIHKHYKSVAKQLSLDNVPAPLPKDTTYVILVSGMHQGTLKAVQVTKMHKPRHIKAVHIAIDPEAAEKVRVKWERWVPDIPLEIIESPHRNLIDTLIPYIENVDRQWTDDAIVIVIPEIVPTKYWHHFLHSQTSKFLKRELQHREDVIIETVSYRLQDAPIL